MDNNSRSDQEARPKSHGVVFRCPDATYTEIIRYLQNHPEVYIVYTKSSRLKLKVSEEGW